MKWNIFKILLSDATNYYFLANNNEYYVFSKNNNISIEHKHKNMKSYIFMFIMIILGVALIFFDRYVNSISVGMFVMILIFLILIELNIYYSIRSNIEKNKDDLFKKIKDYKIEFEVKKYEQQSKIVSPKYYFNFKVFAIIVSVLGGIGIPNLDFSLRSLGSVVMIITIGLLIYSLGDYGKQLTSYEKDISGIEMENRKNVKEFKIMRVWLTIILLNLSLLLFCFLNIKIAIIVLVTIDILFFILLIKSYSKK